MTIRQSKGRAQLRLLKAADMPRRPLEKELVNAIRLVAHRMGLVTWSGRIYIFNHKPPYLPVLGDGTPDVLGVFRDGRMFGIEAKRDSGSKERESQCLWAAKHPSVKVATVRSVEEAVAFWKEHG